MNIDNLNKREKQLVALRETGMACQEELDRVRWERRNGQKAQTQTQNEEENEEA